MTMERVVCSKGRGRGQSINTLSPFSREICHEKFSDRKQEAKK